MVPSARLQISVLDSDMVMERIKRYREEREQKLREQEEALAREELQHCTFKPRTNQGRGGAAVQKAKGPSLKKMPGMSGFLQQKRRAKEQQEEKRRLEEKIFLTDARSSAGGQRAPKQSPSGCPTAWEAPRSGGRSNGGSVRKSRLSARSTPSPTKGGTASSSSASS